jgi:hypothetical protein
LQIAGDMLPTDIAKKVVSDFKEILA